MTRADQPQQEGTELNKANLLTDETAAKFGLSGDNAVPEKAFLALSTYFASTGTTSVTVLDDDGNPIQGVVINGVVGATGDTVSTDANGLALVVVTADIEVTFVSPYVDIPDYTTTLSPNYSQMNIVTITMPYAAAGATQTIRTSGTVKFRKPRTVDLSLVGGGGGGQGGVNGHRYSSPDYEEGGTGGTGGNILNVLGETLSGEYELVVGAGGAGGAARDYSSSDSGQKAGGNTEFGSWSSKNGSSSTSAVGSVSAGGKGGAGGQGGYLWGSITYGSTGSSGSRQGGTGGNGAYVQASSTSVYTSGTAGSPGGFGGGGGGGGGGGDCYPSGSNTTVYGRAGGKGGDGGLVILFS